MILSNISITDLIFTEYYYDTKNVTSYEIKGKNFWTHFLWV